MHSQRVFVSGHDSQQRGNTALCKQSVPSSNTGCVVTRVRWWVDDGEGEGGAASSAQVR